MNRFRNVARLWNWLPVFRAVAEHESIHKASNILATSPSALSRTVKLLEDALGVPLFERREARLVLTETGERLLSATRNAMRLIDDALPMARSQGRTSDNDPLTRLPVRLQVGASATFTAMFFKLVIAIRRDVREVADIVLVETPRAPRGDVGGGYASDGVDGVDALLRGDLDLVVTHHATSVPADLLVERLGSLRFGVYVGPSHHSLAANAHAGFAASSADEGFFLSEPFVGIPGGEDGWPVERLRHVAASTSSLDGLLAYCMTGELAACLSDIIVTNLGLTKTLHRVADAGPPHILFSIRRKPLPSQDTAATDSVLRAARESLSTG